MRGVVQRVSQASVRVDDELIGAIGPGLLVLVGAGHEDGKPDGDEDVAYLIDKCVNARIFPDLEGKLNRSLLDTGGELLAVSQFTLFGDIRKGRRPSFTDAMEPVAASALFDRFVAGARQAGVSRVATGRFRAHMRVDLTNDGPVTLLLDSRRTF